MNTKDHNKKEAETFASVLLWWTVFIILATVTGIWVKLFWIGWVLG